MSDFSETLRNDMKKDPKYAEFSKEINKDPAYHYVKNYINSMGLSELELSITAILAIKMEEDPANCVTFIQAYVSTILYNFVSSNRQKFSNELQKENYHAN